MLSYLGTPPIPLTISTPPNSRNVGSPHVDTLREPPESPEMPHLERMKPESDVAGPSTSTAEQANGKSDEDVEVITIDDSDSDEGDDVPNNNRPPPLTKPPVYVFNMLDLFGLKCH